MAAVAAGDATIDWSMVLIALVLAVQPAARIATKPGMITRERVDCIKLVNIFLSAISTLFLC